MYMFSGKDGIIYSNNCASFFLFFFFVALFLCGRNKYKKVPPEGNIVLLVGCAVGVGIKKKYEH